MKKIGIITFSRANNYGAKLQAYALMQVLNQSGYDSEVVNYSCPNIEKMYHDLSKKNPLRLVKNFIRNFLHMKVYFAIKRKNKRFEEFSDNYLNMGGVFTKDDIISINEKFDLFIAGSDQVWNLSITDYDWNYFLEFTSDERKYSYAASFGNFFDYNKSQQYYDALNGFQSIMVREKFAKDNLSKIGIQSQKISVVLDPVFLLDSENWKKDFNIQFTSEPYILIYTVAQQKNLIKCAARFSKERGIKVKFIVLSGLPDKSIPESFEIIMDAGPIEFISLVSNAKYVFTTSFHAMAFSLIFNVSFYYELDRRNTNNNSRLEELANLFELGYREIVSDETLKCEEIDWNKINKVLQQEVTRSKAFLINSIK